jgi:hypothetical protein
MLRHAIILVLFASRAGAAEPVTVSEFEAFATGKTLTYSLGGEVYGVEQYLPNRRVLWAFKGEECHAGYYYESEGQVCFVYDYDPEPQCWRFLRDANGMRAHFSGDPEGSEAAALADAPGALVCPGPDVGV